MPTAQDTATNDKAGEVCAVRPIKTYRSKRLLDLVVASMALIIAAPLAAVISALIKLSSPGPVLFKQMRVGKNGKQFMFYKFRSMRVDNDDSEHREYIKLFIEGNEAEIKRRYPDRKIYKLAGDDRVTFIGKFLRRTSLDELPQLLNVFKGEMSMVGPRPHLPYEVDLYQDWHKRRLEGIPGITGWWQIHGRSRVPFQEAIKMDIWYLERQSLILDIRIMCRTITKTIVGRGAC
ncbi:MAG: sugar transferase [Armatimonadetes bacterium]|jgi:lipopolysaccharide/colanic/teichoic acid biosynthesis glycosyltransferase|nr:sugar transferase [Armatimonadota bacterium]